MSSTHHQHHQHRDAGAADCAATCPLAAGTVAGARTADGVFVTDAATGIARRTFLTRSMLAAAAVALAACGMGGDAATSPSNLSGSIKVSDYAALANVGGVAVVSMSGSPVAIVRTGASTFEALSLVCPHEGGSINTSGTGFLCSKHGAQFNAAGTWVGGQRTTNMRSYPTTFDETAGTLTIG